MKLFKALLSLTGLVASLAGLYMAFQGNFLNMPAKKKEMEYL